VRRFSQRVQWTPLLLVISIFACEKPHSVALGLIIQVTHNNISLTQQFSTTLGRQYQKFLKIYVICTDFSQHSFLQQLQKWLTIL